METPNTTARLVQKIEQMREVADQMNFTWSEAWFDLGMDEIYALSQSVKLANEVTR